MATTGLPLAAPALQSQSRLLSLPTELRLQIFEYVLLFSCGHVEDRTKILRSAQNSTPQRMKAPLLMMRRGPTTDFWGHSKMADLLCICRQIFIELEEMMYHNVAFSPHRSDSANSRTSGWIDWQNSLVHRQTRLIKYIRAPHRLPLQHQDTTVDIIHCTVIFETSIRTLKTLFPALEQIELPFTFVSHLWPRPGGGLYSLEEIQKHKDAVISALRSTIKDSEGAVKIQMTVEALPWLPAVGNPGVV